MAGAEEHDVGALLARVPGVANVAIRVPGDSAGTLEATATLSGNVQPLVRELARINLTDLVLDDPDLEEAVLTLYTEASPAPARKEVRHV
ncbi:hypothetical protein M707_10050 [Arthrobacter sp. AK-YN10]|nr:hypothetical protein M707_10050 [Arthrobacter sp. AK-YN10]